MILAALLTVSLGQCAPYTRSHTNDINPNAPCLFWRENSQMIFSVEDQGVGIPKSQLGRIFQRFESRSQGSNHRGAGLGLSIVKSLVELHGGSIEIVSEETRGTRVTVRIPERAMPVEDGGMIVVARGGRAA